MGRDLGGGPWGQGVPPRVPLCPQSAHSGRVLVPGPFLVRDSQQERHFGFSLAQALRRARRHPLLQVTVPNCPQAFPKGPCPPHGWPCPHTEWGTHWGLSAGWTGGVT